jgi:signal transduction histidine kinase
VRYSLADGAGARPALAIVALAAGDGSGRVAFATIDLAWMTLQVSALPAGSALTMVDGNGRIMVRHPDPEQFVGDLDVESEVGRSIGSNVRGTVEGEGVDGVPRVYAFEPLRDGGTIRAGIPSAVVYAQFRRAQRPALVAAIITIVTAFVLSRYASRRLILRRAEALSRAANALSEGRLSARTGVSGHDELAMTAIAFDDMAGKLEANVAHLQELARRSQAALESERKRISRTIHDELGQVLTALRLELVRTFPSASSHPEARLLTEQVEAALQRVRTAALELRPTMLDDLGLCAAVEWQVQEFCRRSSLECSFEADPAADELGSDAATAVFRILQEALTNVARHAEAASVRVALARRDGFVELEVVDDGRGFPAARTASSLGIVGMQERARAVGGTLEIHDASPRGTRVQARVPSESRP